MQIAQSSPPFGTKVFLNSETWRCRALSIFQSTMRYRRVNSITFSTNTKAFLTFLSITFSSYRIPFLLPWIHSKQIYPQFRALWLFIEPKDLHDSISFSISIDSSFQLPYLESLSLRSEQILLGNLNVLEVYDGSVRALWNEQIRLRSASMELQTTKMIIISNYKDQRSTTVPWCPSSSLAVRWWCHRSHAPRWRR